jgi:hypothetical protein
MESLCQRWRGKGRRGRPRQKARRLLFDPLEQRQLLSVTPVQTADTLVNNALNAVGVTTGTTAGITTGGVGPYAVQVDNQSVATNENGDYVVTWTSYDPLMSNGKQVGTEGNIYARYYTNEVQRITLPSGVLTQNKGGTYGNFQLIYNGSQQMELAITETSAPFAGMADLVGTFKLGFDVNGDGKIEANEQATINFNETLPMQTNAVTIQNALQGLGGALKDCSVAAVDSRHFFINFGAKEFGIDEPQIVVDKTSFNFNSSDFLPAVTITPTETPGTTESIPVIPNNPTATAINIQEAIAAQDSVVAPAGVPESRELFSEQGAYCNPLILAGTAPSVTVAPVPWNPLQFDVTFVGASGDSVQAPLQITDPLDSLGNPLTGGSTQVLKGPSPVFMVNNPDPANPGLLVPLNYSRANASVAMDPSGGFVITWEEEVPNNPGSPTPSSVADIFARRFQPVSYTSPLSAQYVQGVEALGNQFQVNTFAANLQSEPSIAMDGSGNFVIAWAGQGQDLSYFNGIIAQRFDSNGNRLGGELHVDTEDTNIHYLPYVATAQDGTFLVTWSSTPDPGIINGAGYVTSVWATVYNSKGTVLVPEESIAGGGDSTASFDANDDYTITYDYLGDVDNNGNTSEGVYATQFQLFATGSTTTVANTVIRPEFRVNSAGTGAHPEWPGYQAFGRVASDANGDLTINYEGFGADQSDYSYATGAEMNYLEYQMSLPANSDLAGWLPGIVQTMYPLIPISSNGNVDGEMNEILEYMWQAGATQAQMGRMRAILDNVLGLLDGEADGISAATFDANPVLQGGTTVLQSDNILNATRDGNDDLEIIDIPANCDGGSFTVQLQNLLLGEFQNITIQVATFGTPGPVNPTQTALNIQNALETSPLVGINWPKNSNYPGPTPTSTGPVECRYIPPGEVGWRVGSPWDVTDEVIKEPASGPGEFTGTAADYYFEVTFQGEVHDTPMNLVGVGTALTTPKSTEQQTLYLPTLSTGSFDFIIGTTTVPGWLTQTANTYIPAWQIADYLETVTGANTLTVTYQGVNPPPAGLYSTQINCYTYQINYVNADANKLEPIPKFQEMPGVQFPPPYQWVGQDGVVVENVAGGVSTGCTPLYAHEFVGYEGTNQTMSSIAMQPDGSYVAVWTQQNEYTAGGVSNDTIESRQFSESVDSVGPQVAGYLLSGGQSLAAGEQLLDSPQYLVVNFDKAMDPSTVTNLNNWALEQADGAPLSGGITQVYYGLNEAQNLYQLSSNSAYPQYAQFSALNTPIGTNQWQAVVVLNGNGSSGGNGPLGPGQWTLVAKNSLHDSVGEPLGRNGWAINGNPESLSFNVILPSGGESAINGDPSDTVDGGTTGASSGNTVASDGNGDFVTVFTLNSTSGSQVPGVYAKIYQMTYTTDASGDRIAAGPTPVAVIDPYTNQPWVNDEILVTSNTTATQAGVAESADGDFVVTWSQNDVAGGWNIWAQAFNAAGAARRASPWMVNSTTTDVQNSPAVAMDASGDFVISWQSNNQDGSGYGIYAQRYDSQGNPLGGTNELQVLTFSGKPVGTFQLQWQASSQTTLQTTPVISYNGNTSATATVIQGDVQGLTDANGFPLQVEVQATSLTQIVIEFIGTQSSQYEPLLNVVNVNLGSSPAGSSITPAIQVPGAPGEFRVNDTTTNNQVQPAVAMDASGEFVISWTSYGEGADGPDQASIYAKKYPAISTLESATSTVGSLLAVYSLNHSGGTAKVTPYVVADDTPLNHVVGDTTPAAQGIVEVAVNVGGVLELSGSGTLLLTGDDILTAAHVVTDAAGQALPAGSVAVQFNLPSGPDVIQAAQIYVDPNYNGLPGDGGDVAVIQLASQAPASATRYDIDRSNDQMGQVMTFEGYGDTGIGATGYVANTAGTLHSGENTFELTGAQVNPALSSNLLAYDFDDGTTTHDAFGRMFGVTNLGLGSNEAMAAPGDSGGPNFIMHGATPVIGAVTLGGYQPPGATPSIDIGAPAGAQLAAPLSDFGEIGLTTSISAYASWIDSVTINGGTEFLVNSTVNGVNGFLNGGRKWSSVAMDDQGEFVVSWTSYGQDGVGNGYGPGVNGMNGIYARRFTNLSQPVAGEFLVNATMAANNNQHSRVGMDAAGDFTVTWEGYDDKTGASTVANSYGIYAQRYASQTAVAAKTPNLGANGEIGGEFEVNTTIAGDQRYPSIALDDAGDTVVDWTGNGVDSKTGESDPQGFYYQQFQQTKDTAGPTVDQVINIVSAASPAGTVQEVPANVNLQSTTVTQFLVAFDENLNTTGGTSGQNSVDNPNNWTLTQGGVTLSGGVEQVQFGYNELNALYPNAFPKTDKWEAVVTFDGTPAKTPNQKAPLGQGNYVLTAGSNIEDLFGNALDGNLRGTLSAFALPFNIQVSTTTPEPVPSGPGAPGTPGAPTTDQLVNLNTPTTNNGAPAVACDPSGAYVVVWVAYGQGTDSATQGNIMAQRYDRFGVAQGSPISINNYTTGSQAQPDVSMDGYGNFIVTWCGQGTNVVGTVVNDGIFAREFDTSGNPLDPQFEVDQTFANTTSLATVSQPAVGMDPMGDFVIAWTSSGASTVQNGIFAQLYAPSATTGKGQFQVAAGTVNSMVQSPDVAMGGGGTFTIVWDNYGQDGSGWGVFGQRYANSGAAQGGAFQVNTYSNNNQVTPRVSMDSAGDFVVTWASYGEDGNGYGVYAQVFQPSGARQGSEIQVNQYTSNYQYLPDVAMDAKGDFVVTWASLGPDNPAAVDYGVYARMFSLSGNTTIGPFLVNATVVGNQTNPSVAIDSYGNFTAVWLGPEPAPNTALNGVYERPVAVDLASYAAASSAGVTNDSVGLLMSYAGEPLKVGNAGAGIFVVSGTSGNDTFSFTGGSSPANWVVMLNNQQLTVPAGTTAVEFDGDGGTDTVTINGTSATGESANITQGAATLVDPGLSGSPYTVTALGFTSATISTGGSGTLNVSDNTGTNLLTMTPTSTTLANVGNSAEQVVAKGFNNVTATATTNGGSTTVSLFGGSGADTLTASPLAAALSDKAGTYSLTANGFATVHANGGTGNDTALLTDAAGGTLNATGASTVLTGAGYSITANNFKSLQATAVGQYDTANLYGTNGTTTFTGTKGRSEIKGVNYDNVAQGFYTVSASGSATGFNTATLSDAAGTAALTVSPQSAALSDASTTRAASYRINLVSNFQVIQAYETSLVASSTATLNGSKTAANVFTSTPTTADATLRPAAGNAFREYVRGFATVLVNSTNANDTANLYDSPGNDTFTGTPTSSTMKLATGKSIVAAGFKTVNAFSRSGGTDTANISGTGSNTATLRSTDALLKLSNGNSIHAWYFANYNVNGGGTNDTVTTINATDEPGKQTSVAGARILAWLSNFSQINQTYSSPSSQQQNKTYQNLTDQVFTGYWS